MCIFSYFKSSFGTYRGFELDKGDIEKWIIFNESLLRSTHISNFYFFPDSTFILRKAFIWNHDLLDLKLCKVSFPKLISNSRVFGIKNELLSKARVILCDNIVSSGN